MNFERSQYSSNTVADQLCDPSSYLAQREGRAMPVLLWIVVLAMVTRMTVFSRQRAEGEFATIDSSAMAQIFIVGLTCCLLLFSTRLKQVCKSISHTSLGLLIGYYLLGAVSALWSPMPKYSLYRAFEASSQLLAVALAMSYCRDFRAAERRVLLISFLTLILPIAARFKSVGFAFSLSAWHTNSYSASAAMIFCYCLGELLTATEERRTLLGFGALVALFWLVLSTSAGSYIAALCGIAVIGVLARNRGMLLMSLLIGIVLLFFLAGRKDILFKALFPNKSVEAVETLHGRRRLWDHYIEKAKEKPLLGHGSFVTHHIGEFAVNNTHNSFFTVLVGTGLLGLGVVTVGLLRLASETRMAAYSASSGFIGCTSAFTVCLVNSMNLPIIWDQWRPPYLVFACFLCLHTLYLIPGLGRQDAAK
ncbi:MAG: hypothetical protein CEE38_04990 [Planctomycetes bacterium B3_Pla]|nr:MAG: hypothetical protein CEE38_04990 [Planctomycetes bacterium B3_Pla]